MTDEQQQALEQLRKAVTFQNQCRGEGARAEATGASRDAREWVEDAARKVLEVFP